MKTSPETMVSQNTITRKPSKEEMDAAMRQMAARPRHICHHCRGRGEILCESGGYRFTMTYWETCHPCGGKGVARFGA